MDPAPHPSASVRRPPPVPRARRGTAPTALLGGRTAGDGPAEAARRDAERWRRLAYDAVQAQGLERERIAAGLHDDIGQTLAVAALKLGELQTQVHGDAAALVTELRTLLAAAARATRSATFELSCPLLAQLGLRAALESVLRRAETAGGAHFALRGDDPAPTLPAPLLGVAFRVARELVHNVRRHARAQRAELRLRAGHGGWQLTVADDGVGFDVARAAGRFGPEGGYGLASALAQVHAVGGRLVLRSRPGRGTVARLWVPMGERADLAEGRAR